MVKGVTKEEEKVLKELKECLTHFLGNALVKLVLYGSKARGDYENFSDIDVAIIVKALTRELKNEILTKVAEIEIKYYTPLSTIVLSEDEFNNLKERERSFALVIEREGIPL